MSLCPQLAIIKKCKRNIKKCNRFLYFSREKKLLTVNVSKRFLKRIHWYSYNCLLF